MDIPRKLTAEETKIVGPLCELAMRLKIFVDGKEQKAVVTRYDIDAGEVERYVLDERGNIVVEGDEAKRETIRGKVEVILADAA